MGEVVKNTRQTPDSVSAIVKGAYEKMNADSNTIVLVAGDSDFVPAVRDLVEDKFHVGVFFGDYVAEELKDTCTQLLSLNPRLDYLALK